MSSLEDIPMRHVAWITCLIVVISGCGQPPSHRPGRNAVKGKVTLDGKPVSPGIISFDPEDKALSPVGTELAANGTYAVELPKGRYEVSIARLEPMRPQEGRAPGGVETVPLNPPERTVEIVGPRELDFELKP
jgi:hypothetical protein